MTVPCWNGIGTFGDGSCERLAGLVHCRNCPVFSEGGRALLQREPPPGLLDEWTEALARPKEETAPGTLPVTVFRLGDEWLALETAVVQKVGLAREAHRIPHRQSDVLTGLVNVDGELVLLASLEGLLALARPPGEAPPRPRLLVVSWRGERWALPVDEVEGIHRVDAAHLAPLPLTLAHAPANHSRGLVELAGRTVAVLSTQRLFESLAEGIPR